MPSRAWMHPTATAERIRRSLECVETQGRWIRLTGYATVTRAVKRVELDPNAVLREAWALYRRLFFRSVLMGAVAFGAIHFVQALAVSGRSGPVLVLFSLMLSIGGVALLQGGLVEIVRGLHADGDDDVSVVEALGRAGGALSSSFASRFSSGSASHSEHSCS